MTSKKSAALGVGWNGLWQRGLLWWRVEMEVPWLSLQVHRLNVFRGHVISYGHFCFVRVDMCALKVFLARESGIEKARGAAWRPTAAQNTQSGVL